MSEPCKHEWEFKRINNKIQENHCIKCGIIITQYLTTIQKIRND